MFDNDFVISQNITSLVPVLHLLVSGVLQMILFGIYLPLELSKFSACIGFCIIISISVDIVTVIIEVLYIRECLSFFINLNHRDIFDSSRQ